MLENTGVPTPEDINSVFPGEERLNQGAVVVIECYKKIPCNPCYTACHRNGILPFADINDRPVVNEENCNGCGLCISKCPGLAIMVVDMTYSDTEALIKLPYEFLPLPEAGMVIKGLDREGNYITDVKVIKVLSTKAMDKTAIVSVAVDKAFVRALRNIHVDPIAKDMDSDDNVIVCRCSDVSLGEIRRLIRQGYTTFDEIKRLTRVGMGPCQSKNCGPIVLKEISVMTGKSLETLTVGTYRQPVKSVKLGEIADEAVRRHLK
jgi:Fe-S-cluster-containing hydrogenase component 2